MAIQLNIPDSVVKAIRLPEDRITSELLVELAISTYERGMLSFGKARELAGVGKYEFSQFLGTRGISRHYGSEELEDDLRYADNK
jgi:predicted HTH domain antitoxin